MLWMRESEVKHQLGKPQSSLPWCVILMQPNPVTYRYMCDNVLYRM